MYMYSVIVLLLLLLLPTALEGRVVVYTSTAAGVECVEAYSGCGKQN